MIPAPLCLHFWPGIRTKCDAGLRAPQDCYACTTYHDGTPYLGTAPVDVERETGWRAMRDEPPRAHFRGQA